jgi:hypothetical protein
LSLDTEFIKGIENIVMTYKLLIIVAAAAIILHHFWQEIGTLREFVDNLKIRVKQLEDSSASVIPAEHAHKKTPAVCAVVSTPAGNTVGRAGSPKVRTPSASIKQQQDHDSVDRRFVQMEELLKQRYAVELANSAKQQQAFIVEHSNRATTDAGDEPSFDVLPEAVWQNPENDIATSSARGYARQKFVSEPIRQNLINPQLAQLDSFMASASETIKSYGDSAVTIKCWGEGSAKHRPINVDEDTAQDGLLMAAAEHIADNERVPSTKTSSRKNNSRHNSPPGSETISLDLTTSSGRLRLIPRVKTPPMHLDTDFNDIPDERLGKAINELGRLLKNRIVLDIDSSDSENAQGASINSGNSSRSGGAPRSKNYIKERVYERQ